jgi:hypothetical protein
LADALAKRCFWNTSERLILLRMLPAFAGILRAGLPDGLPDMAAAGARGRRA